MMRSKPSKAFATRLPDDEATAVKAAIRETNSTKAEFLRRAVRYYIAKNPDRIVALSREGSLEQFWTELME